MRAWEFDLPWKRPPLSLNDRMHWAQKHRITRELRLVARTKTRFVPDLGRCRVTLVWYVNDRRRRDEDNPMVTLKALADGVTDSGVVEDDTHDLMEKRVRIEYVPQNTRTAGIALRIEEIADAGGKDQE